jgi:hypothetical protein
MALVLNAGVAPAQPARALLDTATFTGDARAVYQTWKAYLASKEGRYSAGAMVHSPLWQDAEQRRWPVYDLAAVYLADGALPQVIAIERIGVPTGDEYRLVTRFRSGGPQASADHWRTAMTVTVYAVRDGDHWLLSNALLRTTSTWHRDTVGPIAYVYAPGYPYNRTRAERAVAFTDSVAAEFNVPRLAPMTYYLTDSVDEVYQIMGLESDVKFGPVGGVAQPVNRQLFSGIPAVGEDYRHELAHLVLAPLVSGRTSYVISEGVPTWLGGTSGKDFPAAASDLGTLLVARPTVTLDSILSGQYTPAQVYAAAAVLTDLVYEHGGLTAVKALFDAGADDQLRSELVRLLQRPWSVILIDWRAHVLRFQPQARREPRRNVGVAGARPA